MEIRKQHQVKISNRFATSENLIGQKDISKAAEYITQNIKTSAKESLGLRELKQDILWFDEEGSRYLDQRSRLKCSCYRIQTKEMYVI